jgi:D-alanyl-D-alanine carboxypeptidase
MKKSLILFLAILVFLLAACQDDAPAPAAAPQPVEETAAETTEAPAEVAEKTAEAPEFETEAEPTGGESEASAEMQPLPDEIVIQLDAFLQSQIYSEGADPAAAAPGAVLLVDTPDGQYLQAAGVASLEENIPIEVDDRFEIGSNSKSFVIVILMQLQEEGILSLDDMLSDWLPEQAAAIPNGDQVTLRQLAQHTSGIWDYGDPILDESAIDPDKLVQGYTPQELVQYAIDNGTPDFAPGEEGQWNYSNTGYILLGEVIEKAAADSLENLLQERIFDPLNMESAALIPGVPEPGEIVNGYWWKDDGTVLNTTDWNASQAWAAGGIAMTAEDFLTYGKALSAGELFQDPDSLTQILTFDPNGLGGAFPYGLGLLDFSNIPGAEGFWGHEGETAGFQTLWLTNPDTGITIIGLSNSAAYSAFNFAYVAALLSP